MSESFSIQQSDDRLCFTGELDFTTARQVLQELGDGVRGRQQLTIDFSGAGRCNSAALAILIELQAIARRCGHQVSFTGIPGGIQQLAKVCQVEGYI